MERPTRRMPSLFAVATWWDDRREQWPTLKAHWIGLDEPFCFRCGWLAPVDDEQERKAAWNDARRWLDRAHLIDRMAGGLDLEPNLIPLCRVCHDEMPVFGLEDGSDALSWARAGCERVGAAVWQMVTDDNPPKDGRALLLRWRDFTVTLAEHLVERIGAAERSESLATAPAPA